jgi:hypothetical protein
MSTSAMNTTATAWGIDEPMIWPAPEPANAGTSPADRHCIFVEHRSKAGVGCKCRLIENAPVGEASLDAHLVCRATEGHEVEDGRDTQEDVGRGEISGSRRVDQIVDASA